METQVLEPTTRTLWNLYWTQRGLATPALTITHTTTDALNCTSDADNSHIRGFVHYLNAEPLINAIGQLIPPAEPHGTQFIVSPTLESHYTTVDVEDEDNQAVALPPFTLNLTDRDYELLLTQTRHPEDTEASPF